MFSKRTEMIMRNAGMGGFEENNKDKLEMSAIDHTSISPNQGKYQVYNKTLANVLHYLYKNTFFNSNLEFHK